MAYCTTAQVADELQRPIDGSSKPDSDKTDEICTEISNEIDGILSGLGYSVPISTSATSASSILKTNAILGAGARVERIAASENAGSYEVADRMRAEYVEWRKILSSGKIDLIDATTGTDTPTTMAQSRPKGNFPKDSDGDYTEPRFKDDMTF